MKMQRSKRERKPPPVGQLAARASIPSRVLTEYEEGRQPIPLPHAKLLAKALWVQIEDLLPAAGSTPRPAPNPAPTPPPPTPPPRAPRPQQGPPPQAPAQQTQQPYQRPTGTMPVSQGGQ